MRISTALLVFLGVFLGVLQEVAVSQDGPVQIRIVYPSQNMSVPVDRMFVYGSVSPPTARVYINELDTPMSRSSLGGWLALIPVRPGKFSITAKALLETGEETSVVRWVNVAKAVGDASANSGNGLPLGQLAVHKPPVERELKPHRVGRATTDTVYLRSGPNVGDDQAGFEVRLQKDILLTLVGQIDKTYRVKLSELESLWVDMNAVKLLPGKPPIPQSRVNSWTVRRKDRSTLIQSRLEELLPYRVSVSADGLSLSLKIYGGISNTDWIHYTADDPWIRHVEWSHPLRGVYQLDIRLKQPIWGYDVRYEKLRLVVEFSDPPLVVPPPPHVRRARPSAAAIGSLANLKVCVDPGHPPMGATGPMGTSEHAVNWRMAEKLRDVLVEQGATVVMTRQDNETVPLPDRVIRARDAQADVFISIHANALPVTDNPFEKNGFSVYYYQPNSLVLAEEVYDSLRRQIPLRDDGLHYGNLHVIRQSFMPSILIECGYLMWPPEEELLLDPEFQRECALAITAGLERFLQRRLAGQ